MEERKVYVLDEWCVGEVQDGVDVFCLPGMRFVVFISQGGLLDWVFSLHLLESE